MYRRASLLLSLSMVGCASTSTRDVQPDDSLPWRLSPEAAPSATNAHAVPEPATALAPVSVAPTSSTALAEPPSSPSLQRGAPPDRLHASRFTLKGGHYSAEDADELDSGYIFGVSWMRYYSQVLALEVELGYFSTDGDDGGLRADLWGIPIMTNLRANIPLGPFDVYGGVGLGTIYYDAEVDLGPFTASDDGFVLAADVFVGATINLKDKLALGLEAKYWVTEEISEFDTSLDAFALMLTVGFGR
jgi:hypothetical protein